MRSPSAVTPGTSSVGNFSVGDRHGTAQLFSSVAFIHSNEKHRGFLFSGRDVRSMARDAMSLPFAFLRSTLTHESSRNNAEERSILRRRSRRGGKP